MKGAAQIGGMLLINLPLDQAFVTMRNLIDRHCLRSFYGGEGSDDDVSIFVASLLRSCDSPDKQLEAYFRIFDTLLADGMPKGTVLMGA